jgi:two-component system, sporulation sensor kinase A
MTESQNFSALSENDLFRSAFDYASIGMALVSPDGTWLEVNDSVCRITGYSREELLQKTFQDITHPDDLEKDLAFLQQLLENRLNHYEMEKRYLHKNGQVVWILLTVSIVRGKDGQGSFLISQIQDISERKEIELELKRRKTTLKSVLNNTQSVITRLNREFEVLYINSAVELFIGVPASKIVGRKFAELANVLAHPQVFEKAVTEVFETKRECHIETERQVNGQTVYFITHITPEEDDHGVFDTVLGVTFNITKIKNTEKQLRSALAEIKRLQEILPICSYCKNIRDDHDYWHTVENYITSKTDTKFSHSICPECYETEVKPQIAKFKGRKNM